jgi:signal transduction histidine kinase
MKYSKKIITILAMFLLATQSGLFLIYQLYNNQAEHKQLKSLLLQQTMVLIQRIQLAAEPNEQKIIKSSIIPNAILTITPFPEWPIQISSSSLWLVYKKLKNQTGSINLSYHLKSRKWLNIEIKPYKTQSLLKSFLFVLELFLTVATMCFLFLNYRYTLPLHNISGAVERLGNNLDSAPLKAQGNELVRTTYTAINEMQNKIQRLLQERTSMLAAISHDLRTPLARLRLRTDGIDDSEQQARQHKDLDEMEAMIAQILAYVSTENEVRNEVLFDLTALVTSLCHDFVDLGNEVDYIGTEDCVLIKGDILSIKRAIANVIENAIKYAGKTEINLYQKEQVNLFIADQGKGILEDQLEKVFTPFYRLDSSRNQPGTGLGLSITRAVLHAHNASIRLSQNKLGGLLVAIQFPCV